MLRDGEAEAMAILGRYGQVTRTLMMQIINLFMLAPDIQEGIVFLAETTKGRDLIPLSKIAKIFIVASPTLKYLGSIHTIGPLSTGTMIPDSPADREVRPSCFVYTLVLLQFLTIFPNQVSWIVVMYMVRPVVPVCYSRR